MPRRFGRSASTGRSFSYDWEKPGEPTPDDLNGLFAQGKIQFDDDNVDPPSNYPQPQPNSIQEEEPPSAPMPAPGDGRGIGSKVKSALSIARDTAYGGPQSVLPQVRGLTSPAFPKVDETPSDSERAMAAAGLYSGPTAMKYLYNQFIQPSSSVTGAATDYLTGKVVGKASSAVLDTLTSKFPNAARAVSKLIGTGGPEVLPPDAPPLPRPKALPPAPIDVGSIEASLGSPRRDFVGPRQFGDMRPARFHQGPRGTADVRDVYPKVTPPVAIPPNPANQISPPRPTLRPEEMGSVVNVPADVAAANPDMLGVPTPEPGIMSPRGKQRAYNQSILPKQYHTGTELPATADEYYAGTGRPEVPEPGVPGRRPQAQVPQTPVPAAPPQSQVSITPGGPKVKRSVYDTTLDIMGSAKSLKASADLSAPLRQGFFNIGRKEWWNNLPQMVKSFASEEAANKVQTAIQSHPNYELMKKSGLAVTPGQHEEQFAARLIEKVPGVGNLVKASDRAYTNFLQKLRADVFNNVIEKYPNVGDKVKAAKSVADWINVTTGRGSLGRAEPLARELNAAFFSPRFASSRLQLIASPVRWAKADPIMRKEILRDMLSTTGVFMTLTGTAALAGAKVEVDPRSAEFGKIKIGNTRIDLGAGELQWIRLGAELASGVKKTQAGKSEDLSTPKIVGNTRFSEADRFRRSKMSPVPAIVEDWLRGENFAGEKFNLSKEALDLLVPMVSQDLIDVMRDNPDLLPVTAPLSILGAGVQTYKNQPRRRRANR